MNDRLLKESDVLKAVDKRIEELSKNPVFIRKNGSIDLYGIKKYLLAIPTAERPQGEWIVRFPYKDTDKIRTCSNCNITQTVNVYDGVVRFKFCPYCGAIMREKEVNK